MKTLRSTLAISVLLAAALAVPAGAVIVSNGVVGWTPPEGFLPATNTIVLRVSQNGPPSLSATNSFQAGVNHPPVPTSPTVRRFVGTGVKMRIGDLLGTDVDGDNLVLSALDSMSAQGGTVVSNGTWVFYAPAASTNTHSFNYTVSDNWGGFGTGTVTIMVVADANVIPSFSVVNLTNGSFQAEFSALPGRPYSVQASTSLVSPNWQTIGTALADASGIVEFVDTPPGGTARYYQLIPPN